MTDEEYNAAFANYDNLNPHEKVTLIRRVVNEINAFMLAKDRLSNTAAIRNFVRLLPSMQQRQRQMDVYLNQLKAFIVR